MTGTVVALQPKERVRQDGAPIALMYRTMGTAAAERVVSRALGEVRAAVATLAHQVRVRSLDGVGRRLRRLQRMADDLGMVGLAQVAADCQACHAAGDSTAFAAVWARLVRVADCSLATGRGRVDMGR